jgi:hypothetical protein
MALSTVQTARLQARLDQAELRLADLYAAALAAIPNSEVSQYEFDSGEGRQRVWRRSPLVLQQAISRLEKEIDQLYSRIECTGLARLTRRR